MNTQSHPDAAAIRQARQDNPKPRERDLAGQLGISEAVYLEAFAGEFVERIEPDPDTFFPLLCEAGEVMALSRNANAVHEKIGVYANFSSGPHASVVLGKDIDLRIFPKHWRHAYHVAKPLEGGTIRHSFQFFDACGDAVHKVFAREATDMDQWRAIAARLARSEPGPAFKHAALKQPSETPGPDAIQALRQTWAGMVDTHQFQAMLRKTRMSRHDAIRLVGDDYAFRLAGGGAELLFDRLAADRVPVMAFVRNPGILQIHSGPVENIKQMGPWLNVLDQGFHLHLRKDRIAAIWLVRKPTKSGDIFSIEMFDDQDEQIILINGDRRGGDVSELVSRWDELVKTLPRADTQAEMEPAQ